MSGSTSHRPSDLPLEDETYLLGAPNLLQSHLCSHRMVQHWHITHQAITVTDPCSGQTLGFATVYQVYQG